VFSSSIISRDSRRLGQLARFLHALDNRSVLIFEAAIGENVPSEHQ
jgi:hypothetical protein